MNNLLKKIRNEVNKILIPFLVNSEMYHLLSILMILNLKKLRKLSLKINQNLKP